VDGARLFYGGVDCSAGAYFGGSFGQVLGSFCNFFLRGQGLILAGELGRQSYGEQGVCLQSFELVERAMEGALYARFVAGETVELGGEIGVVGELQ